MLYRLNFKTLSNKNNFKLCIEFIYWVETQVTLSEIKVRRQEYAV